MNKCDSVDWCIKLTCRNIISNVSRTIEIIVYPVLASPTTQQEDILIHRRGILRNLMQFEVFRLLSFGPINDAVIVDSNFSAIQFAQEGFYDASGLGHYCCFSCNYTFTDVSANRHHHVNCRHLVDSVSIRDRGHLLTSNMFTLFNSIFSNPSNQPFVSEDDHDIHPQRGRDNLNAVNHLLPRNETLPVYAFPEIYIDENDGINVSENQFGNSFAISNSQERENHSVQVSANRLMLNGAPQGVALSSENTVTQLQHSLPTYVNEVSGSVGIQESDAADSVVLLTSLSIKPVPFTHTPSQAAIISKTTAEKTMNAQNPPEEGAVGGHTTSFELSGASYPQFASSSARRATFTGWNPDHPQRPDDLAAGGFFYAGYADCVRCFNCGLGLKYWRPSDIPAYQHARFRPNCVYNKMYKGQDYINKVQQDLQEEQARVQAAENNRPDNQVVTEFTDLSGPEQPPPPPPPDPSPAPNEPDHEYLRLPAAQEALRVGWRADQVIQAVTNVVEEIGVMAQNLQQDVLFDVLRELYSADDVPALTGINNSRRDDSISSSSIADTSMATIRPRISADEPINTSDKLSSLAYTSESTVTEENSAAGASEVPDGSSREDPIEQYQAIVRENAYLNQRTICMICQMRPVGCVFLPCGHVIACQICALNERTCRACNKVIVGTSSVYLS